MAWWYRKYAKEQPAEDQPIYENAELMSQLGRLGLWGDTNPMPPWISGGKVTSLLGRTEAWAYPS